MSQQINLLNPALRPKPELLSLNHIALAASWVLVLVLLAGAWAEHRLDAARARLAVQAVGAKAAQAQLAELTALAASQRPSAALVQEVERMRQLLHDKREALRILERGSVGSTEGFAPFMEALAQSVPDGVWLTGFEVQRDSRRLRLEGRMLAETLLPVFVTQMNRDPRLQGQAFAALHIVQYVPPPAASGQQSGAADSAKDEPPHWRFVLGSDFDQKGQP